MLYNLTIQQSEHKIGIYMFCGDVEKVVTVATGGTALRSGGDSMYGPYGDSFVALLLPSLLNARLSSAT